VLLARDNNGESALHWAASEHSDDSIVAMLDGLSAAEKRDVLLARNGKGGTALDVAVENNRVESITAMLSGMSSQERGTLLLAADSNGYPRTIGDGGRFSPN
jgi:ankyrin repeat protein